MPSGSLDNNPLADPPVATLDSSSPLYSSGPSVFNNYRIEEGICILPVAEDPPDDPTELQDWSPVVVLRLHSPYRIRTARFSAKKNNVPPILPAPGDQGKFVFTGASMNFTNVLNSDSSYDWITTVAYTYVENCISRTIDGFVLGQAAFNYDTQVQNASLVGGSPSVPPYGAISEAGLDPKIGYLQAQYGPDNYNTISYFPGLFFNDGLFNGDLGGSSQQFSLSTDGWAQVQTDAEEWETLESEGDQG